MPPLPTNGPSDRPRPLPTRIETGRLQLLAMPLSFLEACRDRDRDRAESLIGLQVPDDWLGESELIQTQLVEFEEGAAYASWGVRAVGLTATRTMIGHVGFHSLPDPEYLQPYWPGGIELAYTVYPDHRRRGHGFEAVAALMYCALGCARIRRFLASVAASNLASRALARKLGFVKTVEHVDDESRQMELLYVLEGDALQRFEMSAAAHQLPADSRY